MTYLLIFNFFFFNFTSMNDIIRPCNPKILVCVFKQQFSIFLEIRVGENVCKNTCNVI